jgi:hypothetical protein
VLGEHVEGLLQGCPALDAPGVESPAGGGDLHQLEGVRGHASHPARRARLVAAAAGALREAGDPLGAPHLQDAVDRREVDAQVEAGGADHAAQAPPAEPVLHPVAHLAVEGAMVEGDLASPVGTGLQDRLVPDLRLRAGVGED